MYYLCFTPFMVIFLPFIQIKALLWVINLVHQKILCQFLASQYKQIDLAIMIIFDAKLDGATWRHSLTTLTRVWPFLTTYRPLRWHFLPYKGQQKVYIFGLFTHPPFVTVVKECSLAVNLCLFVLNYLAVNVLCTSLCSNNGKHQGQLNCFICKAMIKIVQYTVSS